jgi:hypothetical protein
MLVIFIGDAPYAAHRCDGFLMGSNINKEYILCQSFNLLWRQEGSLLFISCSTAHC